MMFHRYDIACCVFVSLFAVHLVSGQLQGSLNIQRKAEHLPDTKFSFNEYSEYSDPEDREKGSLTSRWNQVSSLTHSGRTSKVIDESTYPEGVFDKNIRWDSSWVVPVEFVQISAVSIDPNGNIAIFHRGSRVWVSNTFDNENRFNPHNGPVKENTVVLLDKAGKELATWGSNMFYLPHGLTIDSYGNYWITDVALHQVFKFDAKDVERHIEELKKQKIKKEAAKNSAAVNTEFPTIILKPSIVLGKEFEPGNDDKRFCKPTAVAIHKSGDFFVSDGYCNYRIIKYNAKGERILEWGRHWGHLGEHLYHPPTNAFFVPHALSIAQELDVIFVADRENGRVVSFHTRNGTFYREYRHSLIGSKVYSVAYARGRLYLINGRDIPSDNAIHVHGFVLDVATGVILSQFGPGRDMDRPHDIAVTENASEIYVVELNSYMAYRFLQDINNTVQTRILVAPAIPQHEPAPLMDNNENASSGGTATATLVLSLVTAAVIFIALCVAIAAVVARCQKRGRLFQYEESAVEFSKLVE